MPVSGALKRSTKKWNNANMQTLSGKVKRKNINPLPTSCYDEHGNEIRRSYFGPDGEPLAEEVPG